MPFNYQTVISKPLLAPKLKYIWLKKKLMVCLRQNLSYRSEHLFIFQKKINTVFLNKVDIQKIVYINSGWVLIFDSNTLAQ